MVILLRVVGCDSLTFKDVPFEVGSLSLPRIDGFALPLQLFLGFDIFLLLHLILEVN